MMQTRLLIFGIFSFALMTACSNSTPSPQQDAAAVKPEQARVVGADRDAHGCIGSAGYAWCARTNQCERPWELAAKHGFANTPQAFNDFCARPAAPK